jgi:hydroxymethylpyrimidine pyrophosphatase-like HAD family hydrolase
MNYKILALDIDGTLVNTKKEITSKVKTAVNNLQDKNIPVLIASG